MKYRALDLGLIDYTSAQKIQLEELNNIRLQISGGVLIFAEFLPVYTIGRSGSPGNLLVSTEFLTDNGIKVYKVERGGDITVHSPGQLVTYPIFNLSGLKKDLNWFLRSLEEAVIKLLFNYGVISRRRNGLTGVWVGDEKIAFIGISVSRWATYHGLSLNINNDLSLFDFINPCGLKGCKVTSISKFKNCLIDIKKIKEQLIKQFEDIFSIEIDEEIEAAAMA